MVGKLFREQFAVKLQVNIVTVTWVLYTILTFLVGYDFFVQPFELFEQIIDFSCFIFDLVLPYLELIFLEYLIIVYDLLNLILLYFISLERKSSESKLFDKQLHSCLYELAILRKESFQPV